MNTSTWIIIILSGFVVAKYGLIFISHKMSSKLDKEYDQWVIDKYHTNELSDEQEELILTWLKDDLFPDLDARFYQILSDDKYSIEDRKMLSECREEYILFSRTNDNKPEKNYEPGI